MLHPIFFCPFCDIYFNRTSNLVQLLTSCTEQAKDVSPKSVYQIRETLFDKLNSSGIEYVNEQALFKHLVVFDYESIFIHEESFDVTEATKWFEKPYTISVSAFSNLVQQPIFLYYPDPR